MNGKLLALLLLTGVTTYFLYTMQPNHSSEFAEWKKSFGKTYASDVEEHFRKGVYALNAAKIAAHNADSTQTYTMGVNQFADLTSEEFAAKYLTLKVNKASSAKTMQDSHINGDIDWVAAGKVTGVKDQGQCGSCWAFSATAAHESALLLAGQGSVSLAEQQLVDCSGSYGNMGCNGGWMDQAFSFARDKGLTTTSAYPYVARDQACKIGTGAYRLSGFVDVPGCDNLWNALSARPVSVAVDASNWSFYRSGVFSNCGTAVNHGVLLVAGSDSAWTIKNSWSGSWGENGFIRLSRGNTCAVCSYPSYPTL